VRSINIKGATEKAVATSGDSVVMDIQELLERKDGGYAVFSLSVSGVRRVAAAVVEKSSIYGGEDDDDEDADCLEGDVMNASSIALRRSE
jgi:hypothetical protein